MCVMLVSLNTFYLPYPVCGTQAICSWRYDTIKRPRRTTKTLRWHCLVNCTVVLILYSKTLLKQVSIVHLLGTIFSHRLIQIQGPVFVAVQQPVQVMTVQCFKCNWTILMNHSPMSYNRLWIQRQYIHPVDRFIHSTCQFPTGLLNWN